jgi:hypothetical protein
MPHIMTHVWYWKPRIGAPIAEPNRLGLRCRPLIYGRKNSVLVEMETGEQVVTSRHAIMSADCKYIARLLAKRKGISNGPIAR